MSVTCEECIGNCDMAFYTTACSLDAMTRAAESIPNVGESLDFGGTNKRYLTENLKGLLGQLGCGLSVEQIEYRLQQEVEAL